MDKAAPAQTNPDSTIDKMARDVVENICDVFAINFQLPKEDPNASWRTTQALTAVTLVKRSLLQVLRMPDGKEDAPKDVVLWCPSCGKQHIDEPETCPVCHGDCAGMNPPMGYCPAKEKKLWTNPPHKSHKCVGCGTIWRQFDFPTNGVHETLTSGENDTPRPVRREPSKLIEDLGRLHSELLALRQAYSPRIRGYVDFVPAGVRAEEAAKLNDVVLDAMLKLSELQA